MGKGGWVRKSQIVLLDNLNNLDWKGMEERERGRKERRKEGKDEGIKKQGKGNWKGGLVILLKSNDMKKEEQRSEQLSIYLLT